jgi:hypothetical protein
MMRPSLIAALIALPLGTLPSVAQNYCSLLDQPTAVGANPSNQTADEILRKLSNVAPFNIESIKLRDARDVDLKKQGAAAEVCNRHERWIFYDPDFIEQIQTKGRSYWPTYFVFAHEVAHHFNNDPQFPRPDQELQADRSAARWLTSLGASAYDLENSVNAFVVNETSKANYPGRCDRLNGVIVAYNEEAEIIRSQGGSKPLAKVSACKVIAEKSLSKPSASPPVAMAAANSPASGSSAVPAGPSPDATTRYQAAMAAAVVAHPDHFVTLVLNAYRPQGANAPWHVIVSGGGQGLTDTSLQVVFPHTARKSSINLPVPKVIDTLMKGGDVPVPELGDEAIVCFSAKREGFPGKMLWRKTYDLQVRPTGNMADFQAASLATLTVDTGGGCK